MSISGAATRWFNMADSYFNLIHSIISFDNEWMNEWKIYSLKLHNFYEWEQCMSRNKTECQCHIMIYDCEIVKTVTLYTELIVRKQINV